MLLWYRVESILGQGGFGITYLANDTNLKHKVAIKEFFPFNIARRASDHTILNSSPDIYKWGLSHFISEAQTLAKCGHRNIVSVNSVFEANGTAYIVMEYIRGQSLKSAINNHWQPDEPELKRFVFALMDGLSHIHDRGFIHRDIKPDNIILRENMNPVLVDFGSARQSNNEMTSLVSSGYTPFEQYDISRKSNKQGPWTDIYSLGATMYTVITGKCPVDSVTRLGSLQQGTSDPLPRISKLAVKGYSAKFLKAIDSALAVQPKDRPQSIEEWKALFSDSTSVHIDHQTVNITDTNKSKQARRKQFETRTSDDARTVVIAHNTGPGSPQQAAAIRHAKSVSPSTKTKWLSLFLISLAIGVVGIVVTFNLLNLKEAESIFPESTGVAEIRDRPNLTQSQTTTVSTSAEIQDLLHKAENDIRSSRLVLPSGRNAQDRYLEVLELDPDNAEATAGLERIRKFHGYLDLTESAIMNNHIEQAEVYLRLADKIFPGIDITSRTWSKVQKAKAIESGSNR